jgi:PAS domain S-box-containing protein
MLTRDSDDIRREIRILIVEDSDDDLELIRRELVRADILFKSTVVRQKAEYVQALSEFEPDIIISDHSLPQFNSIEALKISKAHSQNAGISIPFILVTGSISEEFAVKIIKAGADDYILKDRLKRLPSAIWNALEKSKAENEIIRAQAERTEIFNILQKSLNEIYIFDAETLQYKYVNDGALANLGYQREEIALLTPIHVQTQIAESSFRDLLNAFNDGVTTKQVFETQYQRKDGTSYSAEVNLQPVMFGKRPSFVAVVIDKTDVKKYLLKLEQQDEKLSNIAWVQSHEVRGPLSRIMGLAMLISRRDRMIDLDDLVTHLLNSAKDLDDVVKKIVRNTEDPRDENFR